MTEYAHLLQNCFLQHHKESAPKLVRWNALGGTGKILNVDGSSIGNPGIFGYGVLFAMRMELGYMASLVTLESLISFMRSLWQSLKVFS
jgi:hypothetical protein